MEGLAVLLGLIALAIPVLLIVLLVWVTGLAKRLRALEDRLAALQARPEAAPLPPGKREAPPAPPEPVDTTVAGPAEDAGPSTAGVKEPAARPAASEPPRQSAFRPPKAIVMRAENARALADWFKANWIYAVSAVSLAFAGLFFVQYGIETGLLQPPARVAAALVFGAALVIAGEVIRRRWGDREDAATALIPSVFSGAGIVTLFGAVLAALHLYALIGPATALAGLIAVAGLAVVLGWYTGPLLAAIGLLGSTAAPFLVGGESDTPWLFYGYFGLVVAVGLAIDAGRHWAWVSVLTLAAIYPAGALLYLGAGYPEAFSALLVWVVLASMAIPLFTLAPAHGGAATIESFFRGRPRGWPAFPTRLVAASVAASVAGLVWVGLDAGGWIPTGEDNAVRLDTLPVWLVFAALGVVFLALVFWADTAEALEDLAALPAAAIVALPVLLAIYERPFHEAFVTLRVAPEGTPIPPTIYLLVAVAGAVALLAAWRSWRGARWPVAWGAGAALVPPAMIAGLEITWQPAAVLGAYPWALTANLVAAAMTALALIFARRDGDTRPRVAGFALAALALIAFALALILTETALTLSLAVTTAAAAALDRRFTLRPLAAAVQIGAVIVGWRLVFDPGIDWAIDAPIQEIALAFGGTIAALGGTLWLLHPLGRPMAKAVVESAAWSLAAVFASILLFRGIEAVAPMQGEPTHWYLGLLAVIWFSTAAAQLWRAGAGGALRSVRFGLAGLFAVIGFVMLGVGATLFNPALEGTSDNLVRGLIGINTLIPAYLLPALLLTGVAWRFGILRRPLRLGLAATAGLLSTLWLFLAIRHAWRGDAMSDPGFTDPELYTYTIALLVIGGGLLWQAIARRSALLRMIAMGVIALTVAKVFLVDMSGLVGLLRVFSFLALGLALAGLAFLNRWAAGHIEEDGNEERA